MVKDSKKIYLFHPQNRTTATNRQSDIYSDRQFKGHISVLKNYFVRHQFSMLRDLVDVVDDPAMVQIYINDLYRILMEKFEEVREGKKSFSDRDAENLRQMLEVFIHARSQFEKLNSVQVE